LKPKVQVFAPGADVLPGVVKAVDLKGHTPGHSGYQITSGQDSLLYVGDSTHHSVISVQRPDWAMGFDTDQAIGAKTRTALAARSAASGQRIYAVHFPFPGLGKIEKRGDGTAWSAE
jgi:glyoxylase-like metal-dependent hydrolase (beta-lactamase superfamily II)